MVYPLMSAVYRCHGQNHERAVGYSVFAPQLLPVRRVHKLARVQSTGNHGQVALRNTVGERFQEMFLRGNVDVIGRWVVLGRHQASVAKNHSRPESKNAPQTHQRDGERIIDNVNHIEFVSQQLRQQRQSERQTVVFVGLVFCAAGGYTQGKHPACRCSRTQKSGHSLLQLWLTSTLEGNDIETISKGIENTVKVPLVSALNPS